MRYGLKEAIKRIPNSAYPYVITACPDGEGCWFQETHGKNSELAETLKLPYKSSFSKEKVEMWADCVDKCSEPLTIVDIGGIIDEKNEEICKTATHAIILYRMDNPDQLQDWRAFCKKLDIKIIAEIISDLNATHDAKLSLSDDGIFRGTVHHLDRGDLTIKDRPVITELANIILTKNHKEFAMDMDAFYASMENNVLKIGFGQTPAQNDVLLKEAENKLDLLIKTGEVSGGEIIKINGPTTVPVAFVLAHKLNHLYQAVAMYDPKLSKYVVTIAHGDKFRTGDIID